MAEFRSPQLSILETPVSVVIFRVRVTGHFSLCPPMRLYRSQILDLRIFNLDQKLEATEYLDCQEFYAIRSSIEVHNSKNWQFKLYKTIKTA